ncbi:MAG: glycosyltransferase family 4 protein [Bacillota bacterium]|nr:glycosyltransferase family 4 protein [Bacillota bacterium]
MTPVKKLVIVSTYPPRHCGLATFSQHLREGLLAAGLPEVQVIPMVKDESHRTDAPEVLTYIRHDVREDYPRAARAARESGADAVLLQHEYGIFGGEGGSYILEFLEEAALPVVATLHTVLEEPRPPYGEILQKLMAKAAKGVVMARKGEEILRDVYGIAPEKIALIPHGVPLSRPLLPDGRKKWGWEGRQVLMTFGLLGPGKGVETVLEALPRVVEAHPHVLYAVVGATHPEVKKREGEAYRRSLEEKAQELGLEQHVQFIDRFVSDEELLQLLAQTDVYVSPYPHAQQITSGTLTYALAMGCPTVSTPYTYARELLSGGAGVLVPFRDPVALAQALNEILGSPQLQADLRRKARQRSQGFDWESVARRYLDLVEEIRGGRPYWSGGGGGKIANFPPLRLDHLRRMTDDTGLIQHALGAVPNRWTGYTTDDNARALLLTVRAAREGYPEAEELAHTYLAFLAFALEPSGWFHNNIGYDRRFLPEERSADTQARALWALAEGAHYWGASDHGWAAADLFRKGLHGAREIQSLRGWAGLIMGLSSFWPGPEGWTPEKEHWEAGPGAEETAAWMDDLAQRLVKALADHKDGSWRWFEDQLTYENALLPLALLRAGRILEKDLYGEAGLEALGFLSEVTFEGDLFVPVGNDGWYPKGGRKALYDQQPLEAGMMVWAALEAYRLTEDSLWRGRAEAAGRWFLGHNTLGVALYDERTGGCRDGLSPQGVSRNQGAESTLVWLLARQVLEKWAVEARSAR